jgi:serine/threonine protein kinase/tetratricopeptide (TPR) repeat protein
MKRNPSASIEQQFTSLVAACDDALAALDSGASAVDLPPEMRARLERDLACMKLLQQLRPSRPPSAVRAGFPSPATETPAERNPSGVSNTEKPAADPVFKQLARFEIRRELGRGGFGIVYLAYDPQLRREVALKILRADALVNPEARARFQQEARAAAALDHPSLVPVYEAGADGPISFIALGYCPGPSLAAWLKSWAEPVPLALASELIAILAAAVQHAHERGVLHRDLKPANILLADVRGEGSGVREGARKGSRVESAPLSQIPDSLTPFLPKITDFGLAKCVEVEQGQTRTDAILGTPSYMAPEQAAGRRKNVGPATDVYALGAILYELLTGRPPFHAETPMETLWEVQWHDPLPPSRLRARIPRDLETICLQCLHKEPHRRYASAALLAEDLRLFLAGKTIRARPVGWIEFFGRWCRRRPAVVGLLGAVTALLVVLITGGLVAAWLLRHERDQLKVAFDREQEARQAAQTHRERSDRSYQLAREALGEVMKLKEHPDFQQGKLESVKRTLTQIEADFYQKFVEFQGDEEAFRIEQARAYFQLGSATDYLKSPKEALAPSQQALVLYLKLAQAHPDFAEYQLELAKAYHNVAVLYTKAGDVAAALVLYEKARDIQERLARTSPNVVAYWEDVARTLHHLGMLQSQMGQPTAALDSLEHGRDIQDKLAREHPGVPAYQDALANIYDTLGTLQSRTDNVPGALESHGRSRKIWDRLTRDHPGVAVYQRNLAQTFGNVGYLQKQLHDGAAAIDSCKQARVIQAKLAHDHPNVPGYQQELAGTDLSLGVLYMDLGQTAAALEAYERARTIQEKLARDHPGVPAYRRGLVATYNNLGILQRRAGDRAAALDSYEQVRTINERLAEDYPLVTLHRLDLGGTYVNLGNVFRDMDQPAHALPLYAKAIPLLEGVREREPHNPTARMYLCNAYTGRAISLGVLSRHAEALNEFQQALDLADEGTRNWTRLHRALALAHLKDHRTATSEAKSLSEVADLPANTLYDLARVYALSVAAVDGDTKWAEQYAVRAVELLRQAVAKGYREVEHMEKDGDLESLRSRADFQKLLRPHKKPAGHGDGSGLHLDSSPGMAATPGQSSRGTVLATEAASWTLLVGEH